jgi:hypothetical protein
MIKRQSSVGLAMLVLILLSSGILHADYAKIGGKYCYQYGDSESLVVAKEISYAMALRKAIETYKTFVASTSVVEDYRLRKDLVETIASGYVDNIRILRQEVKGRTVCTELVGRVNPQEVKTIIARKVERETKSKGEGFEGLVSNKTIKILNYTKTECRLLADEKCMVFVYQAKSNVPNRSVVLIIDCFDMNGDPMTGTRIAIPSDDLYAGEVRTANVVLPSGTVSFDLRFSPE